MKISDVRTYPVRNPDPGHGGPAFLFVKLTTDGGVEGIGEIFSTPFSPPVAATMTEDICDRLVIGADPFKVERLWRIVYSSGYTQHAGRISMKIMPANPIVTDLQLNIPKNI